MIRYILLVLSVFVSGASARRFGYVQPLPPHAEYHLVYQMWINSTLIPVYEADCVFHLLNDTESRHAAFCPLYNTTFVGEYFPKIRKMVGAWNAFDNDLYGSAEYTWNGTHLYGEVHQYPNDGGIDELVLLKMIPANQSYPTSHFSPSPSD